MPATKSQRRNRQRKNRRNSQRGGFSVLGYNFFESAEEKAKREAEEKAKATVTTSDEAEEKAKATVTTSDTNAQDNTQADELKKVEDKLKDSGFAGGKQNKSKKNRSNKKRRSGKKRSNKKR